MDDLRDLYQEVILDHGKNPRNHRKPEASNREAEGFNPLCGDHIWIYAQVDGGSIGDVAFQGQGCAICTASASVMTQTVKGMSEKDVLALFERFHAVVTGKEDATPGELGKLQVFVGVKEFPVRVKCATLPWHTLQAALARSNEAITTE